MIRYQTKKDRLQQVVSAIIPGSESKTGNPIYIDLLTITDSSEENHSNYQIKHGNFFPDRYIYHQDETIIVENATWDQFYIDGKDNGYPQGFQTLEDVEYFIREEIERIKEKKTKSIVSSEYSCDGITGDQWNRALIAWQGFQQRFLDAKYQGKLIDIHAAKEMKKGLMN